MFIKFTSVANSLFNKSKLDQSARFYQQIGQGHIYSEKLYQKAQDKANLKFRQNDMNVKVDEFNNILGWDLIIKHQCLSSEIR